MRKVSPKLKEGRRLHNRGEDFREFLKKRKQAVETVTYEELSTPQKRVLKKAEEAMNEAFSPYFNFFVGAAVATAEGKIVTGANRENAAPIDTCAERVALHRLDPEDQIRRVGIITRNKDSPNPDITTPCGKCRQAISEAAYWSNYDIEVIMSNTKKDRILIKRISELLYLPFGPQDLTSHQKN